MYADGELTISDSTIAGNTARTFGGGISSEDQFLQIIRCTIPGNSVTQTGNGGGVEVGRGGATIQDSTIENNQSQNGAGIDISGGDVTLKGVTVVGTPPAREAAWPSAPRTWS